MDKIIMIILYLCTSTLGLIMIKLGVGTTSFEINNVFLGMNISWKLLIGFCSYIISFILWTVVISRYDLSYIYPLLTAIMFIIIMIASSILLKESISTSKIIGVIIIVIGVLITTIKK
jgi:small multidrug resistance pump